MLEIRLAENADKADVMSLYRSLVGTEGLTWSEDYPTMDDVERDIAAKSLYIAVLDGRIIAAAGAGEDSEVSDISSLENPCCLYRVGVSRDFQRRGIAGNAYKGCWIAGQRSDRRAVLRQRCADCVLRREPA